MGFCLHFLLQCLCEMSNVYGIRHYISFPISQPVPVSAITDNSFLQLLMCLCILIFQKFSFLLFLLLLLGWFIVCIITVALAYIKLFNPFFYVQWSVHRVICVNNYPTRCNNIQFIYISKLLYMFQVVSPPIIRSSYHCICSIWYYWDHYCYLSWSWLDEFSSRWSQ